MKRLIATLLAAASLAAFAVPAVKSGDTVIIGDAEWVIVSKGDLERMKVGLAALESRVAALARMEETETGRAALHGRQTHTAITNGVVTVTYADGYTISQPQRQNAQPRTNAQNAAQKAHESVRTETDPFVLAREEMRRRRVAARSVTNEVTRIIKASSKGAK